MNRLWVKISLAITGILMAGIILLISTMFILRAIGVVAFTPTDAPFFAAPLVALRRAGIIAPDVSNEEIRAAFEVEAQEASNQVIEGIFKVLVQVAFAVGLIGVITGVWVSRTLTGPIYRLAEAARVIGSGDLNYRVTVRGSQEITDLAEMFNKMAANLQQAEILRNNLMADVSHELRTPLTVLEGNLRASLDHVYELDEAEIADLYGQTRHLIRLVNDLRELAQAEANCLPLYKEATDLHEIIEETLSIFGPPAEEEGVTLTANVDAALPPVLVDPARLRQILHNLIANALRYTPAGGKITVDGKMIAGKIQLSVADSGKGILPEHLPHVFDRFYRADTSRSRQTGGTGLGLAIVKALVEAHGGSISVNSGRSGPGATFMVILPGVFTEPPHA